MSEPIIRINNLGKMYRLYSRPYEKLMDIMGLRRLMFWNRDRLREFWALRNVDFSVKKGERLGIIGRNGAGKSTLLKIICGIIPLTEGECKVEGNVQALLELGTGFHPEFTGRENINAALAYQNMSSAQIRDAEREIIEFTELEEFIDQPVKTYSMGMYSRLAFAVVTSIRPDILIVDEVLGAGDAYFSGKCAAKMREMVEINNATVLIVSHASEQILRYCEQCIWLERGNIIMRGPAMEVVKAYSKFIMEMENDRLKINNTAIQSINQRFLSRWPGEGSIIVTKVTLCDEEGKERAVFIAGSVLNLRIQVQAHKYGKYNILPTSSLFRKDGINISNFIGENYEIELKIGDKIEFQMKIDKLILGDGNYVFSVAFYDKEVANNMMFDCIDRSFEFKIIGNNNYNSSFIFSHPSYWYTPKLLF